MQKFRYSFEQITIARQLLYWTGFVLPVAIVTGSFVALFLYLLELVTIIRWQNTWLIWLLPAAGLFISILYSRYGRNAAAGNNLILDEIHEPSTGIPARMAPLVLLCTLITHLFGGSAGREGTAVQMGGSMASLFSKWYGLHKNQRRILLMTGIAAGFGAVFGTPVAATVFAMEVLAVGRIKYDALIPCFIAAVVGDLTCSLYGIDHARYHIRFVAHHWDRVSFFSFDLLLLIKVVVAGVLFGLVAFLFAKTSTFIKSVMINNISPGWLIPVIGGAAIIGVSMALGTYDYLGLGVSNPHQGISIQSAFSPGGVTASSWFWKLLLTAITIGTGFKGGEVTPLFFIGAALGNLLASIMGAPVDLFAGLGFIAVFAGATNTPIACTLMGIELFGSQNILYFAVACFTAYYFSGHSGIYGSQRLAVKKLHPPTLPPANQE